MIQLIATEIHEGSVCMTAMITARVDAEKKKGGLKKIFSEVGLTTSAAVNLFICAVAMNGGIPFKIGVKNAEGYEWNAPSVEKKGGLKLGIAEGKYKFPPDFDERFDAMDAEVAELFG